MNILKLYGFTKPYPSSPYGRINVPHPDEKPEDKDHMIKLYDRIKDSVEGLQLHEITISGRRI